MKRNPQEIRGKIRERGVDGALDKGGGKICQRGKYPLVRRKRGSGRRGDREGCKRKRLDKVCVGTGAEKQEPGGEKRIWND